MALTLLTGPGEEATSRECNAQADELRAAMAIGVTEFEIDGDMHLDILFQTKNLAEKVVTAYKAEFRATFTDDLGRSATRTVSSDRSWRGLSAR